MSGNTLHRDVGRRAALLLGVGEAEQVQVRGATVQLAWEGPGFLPRIDVRRDLGVDEGAHAVAEAFVIGADFHGAISISTCRAAT